MNTTEIQTRIDKVLETIDRKKNTIAKKTALIEKKSAMQSGSDFEKEWRVDEIEYLEEDIRRLHIEIEEKEQTLAKYREQLAKAQEKEDVRSKYPQVILDFEKATADAWNEYDLHLKHDVIPEEMKRYEEAKKQWREEHDIKIMSYKDRNVMERELKKYAPHKDRWHLSWTSDEEIIRSNEKDARQLIDNLYARVVRITGNITDASCLFITAGNRNHAVINGFVTGDKGKAEVRSIGCAGYNIVRWHIRTIVTEVH